MTQTTHDSEVDAIASALASITAERIRTSGPDDIFLDEVLHDYWNGHDVDLADVEEAMDRLRGALLPLRERIVASFGLAATYDALSVLFADRARS